MFLNLLYFILFLTSQNLVQLNKMVGHKLKKKKIIFFPLFITEDKCKSAD